MESGLLVLFYIAAALSLGSLQMALASIALGKQKAKLELPDLEGLKAERSSAKKILVASFAAVTMNAMALIVAGMGVYREYARWVAVKGADVVSSASNIGQASYGAAEGTVLLQFVLLAIATTVWSGLGVWLSLRNLDEQIDALRDRMLEMASGSTDLTRRTAVISNDDLGVLIANLNKVFGNLQSLFASVKGISASVSASAHRLDGFVVQADGSLSSFEDSSARVHDTVASQGEAVERSRIVVTSLVESTERISADLAAQAGQVEQSSAGIAEMAASIASVNRSAGRAGELASSLSALSDSGITTVHDTLKGMDEIREASASVKALTGSISKIASQTNLLAMNAAIEAAHAGAAGSGFAVVADEVRSLAETSARSSKEIIGLIRAMEAKIEEGSKRAEKTREAFAGIARAVTDTRDLVQSIASAMAEQSQGAEDILDSVKSLTESTESIKNQTLSQEKLSSEIDKAIADIVEKAAVIEESIQEQAGAAQLLARVLKMVSEESGTNRKEVEELDRSLDGFKV